MTPVLPTFQRGLEPTRTHVQSSIVTLIRTGTTQQSAQEELTESRKNNKLCRDVPTLPLGLIVPDGREAAFFYSPAVGLMAPTVYTFKFFLKLSAGAYALTA